MRNKIDIRKVLVHDKDWYKKIWTLDIQDMSWVEETSKQVDFLWEILGLTGNERVLDLACGFGRHAIELAKRGCKVVGVDITSDYIDEAGRQAKKEHVDAVFSCQDIRELEYDEEFNVVLNMADGAIGYLEDENENLKVFNVLSRALKPGGKHVMDICNGGYAAKHFPERNWLAGNKSLSLADFEWDPEKSIMYYAGMEIKYSEVFEKPEALYCNPTRLYDIGELTRILSERRMKIESVFGDFNTDVLATDDILQIQVYSVKSGAGN
jgi:SAM-dependent methyltransferase